jgi:hypothetical protein
MGRNYKDKGKPELMDLNELVREVEANLHRLRRRDDWGVSMKDVLLDAFAKVRRNAQEVHQEERLEWHRLHAQLRTIAAHAERQIAELTRESRC